MGDATNLQTSFLGGEIAPSMQGRADLPKYKIGLNKSFNGLPAETGAWQRRPGTRVAALTRAGAYAKIIDFDFSQNAPYTAEFTDSHLRFLANYSLVHTYDPEIVQSISTANAAVVTVTGNTVYSNGDMVEFSITSPLTPDQGSLIQGKQFLVGNVSGATFKLFDSVTGAGIDGSTLNFTAGTPTQVQRVLDLATPYLASMLPTLRGVQASNNGVNTLVILHPQVAPQSITSTNPPNPVFAINPAAFTDGPYNNINTTATTITPSGLTGSVTLTASANLFAAADIGRHVRLLTGPAAWASGTSYTTGQTVVYNGAYYVALQNNTGQIPGADVTNWGTSVNVAQWGWAKITAFTNATHVTAAIQNGPLLNTNATATWRLGAFSTTTGWPACGTYHEGRLWLSGVIQNRVDASVSNDIFNFSPTAVDGTVADNNAISYTFNAKDLNSIFWMTPVQTGIICGTQAGEWLISASANGDVLTPTSIQAKRVTKYGCANVEPVDAPFATLFVTRNNKKVFEYLADVFTGKYSGVNVSLSGSHLLAAGVAEIRYQKELSPVMWVRMIDGTIAGCTYRRESPMLSEAPAFSGWHTHALGTGRKITSIAVGPSIGGNLDTLSMVTFDSTDNLYRIELLADMFADNATNLDAWFVDGGTTPSGATLTPTQLTIYGLSNFEGKVVSAYIAGIDAGDYTVTNGQVVIALPAGNNSSGLLTAASIAAANGLSVFTPTQMPVMYDIVNFPANAQSLQTYIGPTTPVTGVDTSIILLDPVKSRAFEFSNGSGATSGIRTFDILSGVQINQASHDQIFGAGVTTSSIGNPYAMGFDGRLYFPITGGNSVPYVKIDPNTLRIIGTAGKASSDTGAGPVSINLATTLAPISIGRFHYLMAPSILSAQKCLNVIETTDGAMGNAGHDFIFDEGVGYSCPTFPGAGIGYSVAPSGGSPALGLYKTVISISGNSIGGFDLTQFPTVQNPAITTTKIGTVTAAQIDATWTHSSISGPVFDQSDGHLLVFASTIDAVTNTSYLVKINSQTAAVIWTVPIVGFPAPSSPNLPNCFVAYGTFDFYVVAGTTRNYYHINTVAGSATITTTFGFNSVSGSVFDARLGGVFMNANFANTGGSPTLLNATPTNYGGQWARLLVNLAQTPATGKQNYIIPAAVGTTFTSQGQRLRPLDPAETGARNGPALGKTRRNHRMATLLLNSTGVKFGSNFTNGLKTMNFKTAGGTAYLDNQLYSGVYSDTVTDDNSYEGMLCWQSTRPYPANILATEGFIQTQDR